VQKKCGGVDYCVYRKSTVTYDVVKNGTKATHSP